ncbi:unnamed protein product, partial [Dovyalis caffra]
LKAVRRDEGVDTRNASKIIRATKYCHVAAGDEIVPRSLVNQPRYNSYLLVSTTRGWSILGWEPRPSASQLYPKFGSGSR